MFSSICLLHSRYWRNRHVTPKVLYIGKLENILALLQLGLDCKIYSIRVHCLLHCNSKKSRLNFILYLHLIPELFCNWTGVGHTEENCDNFHRDEQCHRCTALETKLNFICFLYRYLFPTCKPCRA